jgi:hypothetical protein
MWDMMIWGLLEEVCVVEPPGELRMEVLGGGAALGVLTWTAATQAWYLKSPQDQVCERQWDTDGSAGNEPMIN